MLYISIKFILRYFILLFEHRFANNGKKCVEAVNVITYVPVTSYFCDRLFLSQLYV